MDIRISREDRNLELSGDYSVYRLPIASATTLGGIKVGNNLTIESDGTLNAESTEYQLPTATADTLGGVKVGNTLNIADGVLNATIDTTLSTTSAHPVQNSTITNTINATNSDVAALDSRLDTAEDNITANADDIESLSSTVSDLDTAVDNLSSTVSTQGGQISDLDTAVTGQSSQISDLDGRLDDAEGTIEDLVQGSNELASDVSALKQSSDTDVEYSYLLPVSTWTAGTITYSQRGKVGLINFDITGVCTLPSQTDTLIYQLPDTFVNTIACSGVLITNDGEIEVKIDTTRNIYLYNHDTNSKHITNVKGQLVVVLS